MTPRYTGAYPILFLVGGAATYLWLFAGAFKASTNVIDLALGSTLYVVVAAAIYYYAARGNWLLAVTCATFFLAYVVPGATILAGDPYQSMYLGGELRTLFPALALVLTYFAVLVATERGLSAVQSAIAAPSAPAADVGFANRIIAVSFVLSLCGTVSFGLTHGIEDFSNRGLEGSGSGPWLIFGYVAYLCVGLMCWRLPASRPALTTDLPIVLLAGLLFLLLGWRGSALYPLVIYVACRVERFRDPLVSSLLVIAGASAVYEVDLLSSAMRSVYAARGAINLNESVLLYLQLHNDVSLPMTFSHLDLLGALLSHPLLAGTEVGHASTILPSLLNWIPRDLYPDKPLTTGPTLAIAFFPDVLVDGWRHTSSLTTGPIVEMYYNFDVFGVILGAAFHGWGVWALTRVFLRYRRHLIWGALWPIVIWLVGFSLFFDDLGGFINKVIIVAISTGVMAVLAMLIGSSLRRSRA